MFQNHWRNCGFCTPSSTINSFACFQLWSFFDSDCLTTTSGRLNFCAWLLLFEVLHEIISQYLISFGIYCTTLSVNSFIVNYLCWRCLFVPDTSSVNKFSVIKRTFHWLSTTRTPKIATIRTLFISTLHEKICWFTSIRKIYCYSEHFEAFEYKILIYYQ